MSNSRAQRAGKQNSAASRNPPRPPKTVARGVGDGPPGGYIDVPDPVALKDLAVALGQEPEKILSDAMTFGPFREIDEKISYEHAAFIAISYGFDARKMA